MIAPLGGSVNLIIVDGVISPVSLDRTGMFTGVFPGVVETSSVAAGGGKIVTVTVAVEHRLLSALQVSYVNVSTPMKLGFGE